MTDKEWTGIADNRDASPISSSDVMARFLQIHRHLSRHSRRVMEDFGISGRKLAALRYLDRVGQATIGEISQHLRIRNSSASEMITKLAEMTLVSRTRCQDDNRVVRVRLTPKGEEMVSQAPLGGFGLLRERLSDLAPAELLALSRCMDRLAALLDLEFETSEEA